jgi:hypothetical protein
MFSKTVKYRSFFALLFHALLSLKPKLQSRIFQQMITTPVADKNGSNDTKSHEQVPGVLIRHKQGLV